MLVFTGTSFGYAFNIIFVVFTLMFFVHVAVQPH
ncbi:hypothetical protein SAMN04490183_2419 [Pseudomonas corrugata]|nr:hypothetical protein SAMN04490183_2419 [Pseudomonas corrugata]